MNNLQITEQKENLTSLELLEQINIFRSEYDDKAELLHKTLLEIIRNEFEEEIAEQKILLGSYKDKNNQDRPMYVLTLSQAKQVLVRESKHVRKAVIKYIEKLEQGIQKPPKLTVEQILEYQFSYSKEIGERVDKLGDRVDNITNIVGLNVMNWRKDSTELINKIALKLGGFEQISTVRNEIYEELERRANCKLSTRLTNKRRRMADEGICLSTRNKLNNVDVIADDKKLIEIYLAVVKDFAIKYEVA